MKILLTGFSPFSGMPVNPSQVLVESFEKISFKTNFEWEIITDILPVDFKESGKRVSDLILKHEPDLFIATGVDFAKPKIELEKVAHKNIPHLDMDFIQSIHPSIAMSDLPDNYYSKVDLDIINHRLMKGKAKVIVSDDTGMYVCNHVYYLACMMSNYLDLKTKSFFVHVPYPYTYWIDEAEITPDFTMQEIQDNFVKILIETAYWYLNEQNNNSIDKKISV